jgi:hypothetical protein
MRPALLSLALVVACKGHDPVPDTGDTDGPVHIDTGAPPETDLPVDTFVGETGDTAVVDTAPVIPPWSAMSLSPDGLTVAIGANVAYRLRATDPDGVRTTPAGIAWSIEDHPEVASVVDGVVTTLAAGDCTVTARFDGGEASAVLHVQDTGVVAVTVVDAGTGLPIPSADVQIGDIVLPPTDVNGLTSQDGFGPEALQICAYEAGYVPACVGPVAGRVVYVGLTAEVPEQPPQITGTADLSALGTGPSEIGVGILGPSLPGSGWWIAIEGLMGPPRDATIYGVDVQIPSNMVVEGQEETFSVGTPEGTRGLWALAVPLPLADALALANGNGDPYELLATNLPDGRSASVGGIAVASTGYDAGLVAIPDALNRTVDVDVSTAYPFGTAGNEQALILALSDTVEGPIATSIGTGIGPVTLPVAAEPDQVVAILQGGGLGSGQGQAIALGDVVGGVVELPDWIDIPGLPVVWSVTRVVSFNSDADGQVVVARVMDHTHRPRDLVFPAGTVDVPFPILPQGTSLGETTWDARVVVLDVGTLEELAMRGPISTSTIEPDVISVARVNGDVTATVGP